MRSESAVILDTNVIVAAFLTGKSDSAVRSILDSALAGSIPILLSELLISEYRAVLRRPKIRKLHGLEDAEIDTVLIQLIQLAEVVEDPMDGPRSPDPGDNFLYALLEANPNSVLVTGDRRLLDSDDFPGRIVSLASWAES